MPTVFKGQSYLGITLDTKLQNIGTATAVKIKYQKPKGDKGEFVATVDGTKIRYEFAPGDIDQVGTWKFQAYAEIDGRTALGEIFDRYFEEPL